MRVNTIELSKGLYNERGGFNRQDREKIKFLIQSNPVLIQSLGLLSRLLVTQLLACMASNHQFPGAKSQIFHLVWSM